MSPLNVFAAEQQLEKYIANDAHHTKSCSEYFAFYYGKFPPQLNAKSLFLKGKKKTIWNSQ